MSLMKIIIMTGKFGMGHYVAAEAIKQRLIDSNIEASIEIIDWLHYISPNYADKYYRLFSVIMSKTSRLYNQRYRFLEDRRTDQKPGLCRFFLYQFTKLMNDKHPNLVISTLPICSQIVSLYVDKYKVNIPLITCVTDITGHSEWVNKNTGFYLVGSEVVKQKLVQKGVSPYHIFKTGIPVKLEFDKDASSLQLPRMNSNVKTLIMGGGLGILPCDLNFYRKLDQLPHTDITIITGKNRRLYRRLYSKFQHIQVVGYVDNVYEYMKSADVVISKPGGITTFEAIHAGIPIIALNPSLQQELYNAEYIRDLNIGIVVQGTNDQCFNQIVTFLAHDNLRDYKQRVLSHQKNLEKDDMVAAIQYAIEHLCLHKFIQTNSNIALGKEILNETINFNL